MFLEFMMRINSDSSSISVLVSPDHGAFFRCSDLNELDAFDEFLSRNLNAEAFVLFGEQGTDIFLETSPSEQELTSVLKMFLSRDRGQTD